MGYSMPDTTTIQIATAKDAKSARSNTALTIEWNVDIEQLKAIALRKIVIDTQQAFRGKKFDKIPLTHTVKASDFIPNAVREVSEEVQSALAQRVKIEGIKKAFADGLIDKATHDLQLLEVLVG